MERAGTLERTERGSRFVYAPEFLARHPGGSGIAVHLPLSPNPIETAGVNLHTFFAGLLPEGLRLQALVRQVKTSPDDLFSLLLAAGRDVAGDVSVLREGDEPQAGGPAVDVSKLEECSFPELLAKSLAAMGLRPEPVLAGVQEKISAATIAFPVRGARARRAWILKLEPQRLPGLVANEAFFMQMAANLGIETASTKLVHDRDRRPGLLVERFDRVWSKSARRLVPIHQEDACQLLDRYPADKYRLTAADLARALEVCGAPTVERARLLRLFAFSYLIGNGDLHCKNVSVVRGPAGFRLSPAYDLLSTLPYGDRHLALPIEGRDDNLRRKTFIAFGERFGVLPAATAAILDELADRARPWVARLGEIGLDVKKSADLRRTIEKRIDDLAPR